MQQTSVSKSTLSRLPLYLQSVEKARTETISAAGIARDLQLGEVQVRKDLASISHWGRPKSGYPREALREDLLCALGKKDRVEAVIIGAGRLGCALLEYDGFQAFGLEVAAAFDLNRTEDFQAKDDLQIFPLQRLPWYCRNHDVHLGILAVPAESAQTACEKMVSSGITAILNFAPCRLKVPAGVTVQQENVAASLAHLKIQSQTSMRK